MAHTILAINPGSTSTKIAIFENESCAFKETVRHSTDSISRFKRIFDQYDFRRNAIETALDEHGFALSDLDAVVGRGGMLKPVKSGTYAVSDQMVRDMERAERGEHASNLGCVIAKHIADDHDIPAFIVDPVAVDEMENIARVTGMPEIERQSLFHALNQKAVARKAAADLGAEYSQVNLIIAHLGGGISVGIHERGRVIDVNNALDGDGPMSPERSGTVPLGPLYKMCFSGEYTLEDIKRKNYGKGGLVAHLGTNDGLEIVRRIREGDEHARFIYDAMCYQIAKEIGAGSSVLFGEVDAIVLTGGLAYDEYLVEQIERRTRFIAEMLVYAGEDEMESLALGALRVLQGVERPNRYE